nr:retrovirus-related Pol polyprotein from transposon TNT 1-94 [Tanacetum cinerariifolium]
MKLELELTQQGSSYEVLARNKLDFVDGSCVKTAYVSGHVLSAQWDRCNLLMGLDECYRSIRIALLTSDPLPKGKDAYIIVSREESHRGILESSSMKELLNVINETLFWKHSCQYGSLPKKWLSFSQGLRNANHTQTLDIADIYESQNEPKISKDYKTEYKKVKAKVSLLEAGPLSTQSPKPFQSKNKGLVAKTFYWNEEEVSDDEEMIQVKVLMALADNELVVGKNHARNGYNRVILVIGSVLAKSSQSSESSVGMSCNTCGSNVYLTTDHNDFEHFKRGKFNAKADDGYLLGYSFVSKEFRVFNTRIQQIKETYHVTFDESMETIMFTNTSVDKTRINDSSRYPPDEFLHEDDPSRQYKANSNISYYITPHNRSLTELTKDTHVPEVITQNKKNTPHTKDVEGMLTRSMAAKLTAALASECLFAVFLSEIEPKKVFEVLKHPGWVDAMQKELNQFYRNKVWTLVPLHEGKIAGKRKTRKGQNQNKTRQKREAWKSPAVKFNRYFFFETPKVLLLAWDRVFEIKDAFGNKQYKPEDMQELFRKLFKDVQNIHEELAEYINTLGWNRPAFYDDNDDDDVNYTIAITPVLSTEEPDNSLSMGDEHLDIIPAMESDEVIKSSVEDLVPILSESEGILDTMCNVHLVNNPTSLEAKIHFEIVINSNDDISSSDDDSLYNENIEYVEASSHNSELVSLKVTEIVISEDEEIEDDNLREKLLNVHLLIANIEALKDNLTPSSEFLTKSSSTYPKSFLEETNTFHNSLPEFENFCFDLEEISSGSTTTHSDISLSEYDSFIFDLSNDQFPPTNRSDFTHEEFADELAHIISPPEYDCFYFRNFPEPGEWISSLNSEIRENLSTTRVNLPVEDDHSPLLAYVLSSIPEKLKTLAKGFYPPSLKFLSFNWESRWERSESIAIGSKWMFRNKKDELGTVTRKKERLVAQGYSQIEGINYDKTFAPVAMMDAIRIFLAFATYMNFKVFQMDVKSAFLNGKLKEAVYVKQPPGFESS